MISGFGGSLMSCLNQKRERTTISVGASGALFGLLGAMLSELITNWTIYENKVSNSINVKINIYSLSGIRGFLIVIVYSVCSTYHPYFDYRPKFGCWFRPTC